MRPARAVAHRQQVMSQLDRLPERQRLLAEAKHESADRPAACARRARAADRALSGRRGSVRPDGPHLHLHPRPRLLEADTRLHAAVGAGDSRTGLGSLSQSLRVHVDRSRAVHGGGTGVPRLYPRQPERSESVRQPGRAVPDDRAGPSEAIAHYDQALRLNPLFGNSYLGRAYALAMRGRYDEAIASLSTTARSSVRARASRRRRFI